MEVKYVNLKVEKSKYNPSYRRRPSRPSRRNRDFFYKKRRRINKRFILGIAAIAVFVFLVFTIWNAVTPKVAPVDELKVTQTSQDTASLKWKGVEDADGYIIYKKTFEENDFTKADTIKKADTYTVKNLKPSTDYTFCVTSYKKGDNPLESERRTVDSTTLPAIPVFTDCSSKTAGTISLAWKAIPEAVKYQVQYVKGDDKNFKNAVTKTYKATKNPNAVINGLDKTGPYCLRIRTTASHNDKNSNSLWSDASTIYISENFTLRSDIDPNKPMIALTFDDGPGYNKASNSILDTLEKYNAKATFFMVGKNAASLPANVKRKAALGMELGNHTWNHAHYGSGVEPSDIKKASNAVFNVCGQYPTAFRSPGGMTTGTIKSECKKEKMPIYYWSIDTQDWMSRDADKVYHKVLNSVKDGDIILMHEIYNSTAEAVKRMVPKLQEKGYQLVTCRELMYAKTGKAPVPGVEYIKPGEVKYD
jgi:peptidoglycan/xylan/chitin deacetylase (PgdA/CDA1 family)